MAATAQPHRRSSLRARLRPGVALTLLVVWTLVPLTALVAHASREAGAGRGSFGGGVGVWTEVHWWLGILAVCVTIVHLSINWAIVKGQLGRLLHG